MRVVVGIGGGVLGVFGRLGLELNEDRSATYCATSSWRLTNGDPRKATRARRDALFAKLVALV
jgi:hypothetical protein